MPAVAVPARPCGTLSAARYWACHFQRDTPAMCGRFILDAGPDQLVAHFNLDQPPALTVRHNIAPSQLVAVVAPKSAPTRRGLALLKWGRLPPEALHHPLHRLLRV